ncbi:MAG: transcription-repair coupling factor [Clostridia bacterium]|nr:transcription-repair coupling factor [Clostridia bacterium]
MNFFTELLKEQEQYNLILESLKSEQSPIRITGTCETQKVHLAFSLCNELSKGMLFVVSDALTAKLACQDLSFFAGDNVMLFPPKDIIFHTVDAKSNQNIKDRIKVLSKIVSFNEKPIIVTTIEALSQKIASRNSFINNSISIKEGEFFDIEKLTYTLAKLGYKRESNVEFQGQFSVRGGIVDVFSYSESHPFRIEFWDNEVDTIKIFDPDTQLSIEKINSVFIPPAKDDFGDDYVTLCDYLNEYIAFFDEPHRIDEYYKSTVKSLADSMANAVENGFSFSKSRGDISFYLEDYNKILNSIKPNLIVGLSNLSTSSRGLSPKGIFSITAKSMPTYSGNLALLCDDLNHYIDNQYRIIIPCETETKLSILKKMLKESGINTVCNPKGMAKRGVATLVSGKLRLGFEYPLTCCAFFSDNELLSGEKKSSLKLRRKSNIRDISDINIGDYVVHYAHGIGIYKGIHQLSVDNIVKDYLKIQYKGADMLYVPVNQLDMVNKYIGAETGIHVNKLGGNEWNATKNKVRESLEVLAKDLIELYAKRENSTGFKFSPDCDYQYEFEDTFIYQETEDQIKAIKEVKKDMESSKPMDRLLCGDVGYGKTEVAIRAAFKAVLDSKQVAYLVPTTLLAKQHYDTFVQRMKDFPIKVEMLSRFCSKKQQDRIVQELKNGHVDIIIGTHRILQKDVDFKDLGLLIVDEEQRFGVTHKEKIKELKNNVDVLTLTATPIPRTLNMAMTGLRDMSVLNDPPSNRYPVQTYVMEYDESAVKNAIKRELARGGQVYYLHNRVEGIERLAIKLSNLLPEARIVYAHGKMSEIELESVMASVINKEYDVLVCTTIIETGLDIPNMNTMIIEDADKFGLSQLYQLRGRVGRSSRMAFAYLFVKKNKILDEIAEKRLKAIKEFTEFGSGIKIAMRDLEIRGAGSVLGKKQHGHMNQVGYDLYCKLLDAAVRKLKNNKDVPEDIQVTIDLTVSNFIPAKYIEDQKTRVDIYKAIASIEVYEDSFKIIDELIDRFGDPPQSVLNLIDSALIRNAAKLLFITDISQKSDVIYFKLSQQTPIEKVINYVSENRIELYLSSVKTPLLVYKPKSLTQHNICKNILKILTDIYNIN